MSRHLSKLFDSLCKLKFRLDADGKPLRFGLGMYSKEDEYVAFDRECDLSGQVRACADGRPRPNPGRQCGVYRATRPQTGCPQQPVTTPLSSSLCLSEQMLKGLLYRISSTALPTQYEVHCEKKQEEKGGEGGGEKVY